MAFSKWLIHNGFFRLHSFFRLASSDQLFQTSFFRLAPSNCFFQNGFFKMLLPNDFKMASSKWLFHNDFIRMALSKCPLYFYFQNGSFISFKSQFQDCVSLQTKKFHNVNENKLCFVRVFTLAVLANKQTNKK